ncbi:Kv channel-interacting protein 2 [Hondaea fermentalgiana]|uniref:Kv channel-interacting protein 2 n=1 Tax=Hondaea fermentalgiana TaxID=2315210 RepID=A0A2R5GUG5_9STRA|nr:Kv channel-interacting protein 2 [Hondaea fermentalgiana]|eukprot:GBG34205.1 Kv channel-interacting protein 2 [Hondaea fermentalgiana]
MGDCMSAPAAGAKNKALGQQAMPDRTNSRVAPSSSRVQDESYDGFEDFEEEWEEEGRGSLMPGDKTVTRRQLNWMRQEQSSLGRKTKVTLEEHFQVLLREFRGTEGLPQDEQDGGGRVPRAAFIKYFRQDGTAFDEELFDMIFKLFDADADGEIGLEEFTVAFGFITFRGSVKDHIELAFRLFDTNRDEALSRREFNEMMSSLIGGKLANLLRMEGGYEAFESYVQREHCEELLSFLEASGYMADLEASGSRRGYLLTVDDARTIYNTFLEVNAPSQVNVSQRTRENCRAHIEAFENHKNTAKRRASLTEAFREATREVLQILEGGPLIRFKVALRRGDHSFFANAAWQSLGLDPEGGVGLSLDLFRQWATKSPSTMSIFDELSDLLEAAALQLRKRQRKEKVAAPPEFGLD